MDEKTLAQVTQLLKAGDKSQAEVLLKDLLRQNPRDDQAWVWLTQVLSSDKHRLECINRALAINPNNTQALQYRQLLLDRLKGKESDGVGELEPLMALQPSAPTAPVLTADSARLGEPPPSLPTLVAPPAAPTVVAAPPPKSAQPESGASEIEPPAERRIAFQAIMGIVLSVIIALGLASAGIYLLLAGRFNPAPTPTAAVEPTVGLLAFPTLPPTWTVTPSPTLTQTPPASATHTPTFSPTPSETATLSLTLSETLTPQPSASLTLSTATSLP